MVYVKLHSKPRLHFCEILFLLIKLIFHYSLSLESKFSIMHFGINIWMSSIQGSDRLST